MFFDIAEVEVVLSNFVEWFDSNVLSTIVHSKDIAGICFVVMGLCISVFYRVYIVNVLPVINRRLFLEGTMR